MWWKGLCGAVLVSLATSGVPADDRPNILFAMADDWGYPHASAYGTPVVETPTFDRLAEEGALFTRAFVSSPSCTPCRSSVLTGQDFWRLEEGANLWSTLPEKFPVYPTLLEQAGYHVGYTGKGWGPGRVGAGGRKRNPAGPRYGSFKEFLEKRPDEKPFCFWFGSHHPHRGYDRGSGKASGMDLSAIELPAAFPDSEAIRGDVADYFVEVQKFDKQVRRLLRTLKDAGELDETMVVMTGDHGMPFPRGKTNLYDLGTRVPLAIRWPETVEGGRRIRDFVSLVDLAPTFLDAAGVEVPDQMTGRSLMNVLQAEGSGQIDPTRNYVLTGRERHCPGQEAGNSGGYPMRAIRTDRYLYIRNFRPHRWPAGTPHHEKAYLDDAWYGDIDNGPTKIWMFKHRDEPDVRPLFQAAFGKRPAVELYDIKKDPGQLNNVADDPAYADVKKRLASWLTSELRKRDDPRVVGGGHKFDTYPYYGGVPSYPF